MVDRPTLTRLSESDANGEGLGIRERFLPARRRSLSRRAVQGGLQPVVKGVSRRFEVGAVLRQTQSAHQSVKRLGQLLFLGQAEVQRVFAAFLSPLQSGDYSARLDAISLQQHVQHCHDPDAHVVDHVFPAALCSREA